MSPTGISHRILQIHPTQRCNLQCLHCYSSSGPQEHSELDLELLLLALTDAAKEGYTVASFSGGEPLVYKPVCKLLAHAHECGMTTTMTSNGMLLDEQHLQKLQGHVDLIAISLDGKPTFHNRIRANEQAFEIMQTRLEGIRQSNIPFGFIFTVTRYNIQDLEWVTNFALTAGAKLLQIHPLAEFGRAKQQLAGVRPKLNQLAYVYLQAMRLKKAFANRLFIQVDLAHQNILRSHPDHFFADTSLVEEKERSFADILSPLIIEADGTVVPIQHGFSREYALGNLREKRLRQLTTSWRQNIYPSFLKLCQNVFDATTSPSDIPIIDWYNAMALSADKEHHNSRY
jgi:MoaA/NifB/PqqE/SkfB family radical SAM enzyme